MKRRALSFMAPWASATAGGVATLSSGPYPGRMMTKQGQTSSLRDTVSERSSVGFSFGRRQRLAFEGSGNWH